MMKIYVNSKYVVTVLMHSASSVLELSYKQALHEKLTSYALYEHLFI